MSTHAFYATGNAFSADLKRTAHRVRQAIDAMPKRMLDAEGKPYNPRKRRLVAIPLYDKTTNTTAQVIVPPSLDGRVRHTLANERMVSKFVY